MRTQQSIFYLGQGPDKPAVPDGAKAIPLPLRIGMQSMVFWIGFVLGMANPSEMVLTARMVSNVTIEAILEEIPRRGGRVSCHKGCHAACCRHSMVSLSVPEALAMVNEVNSQNPQIRARTIQSCQADARKIRDRLRENPTFTSGQLRRDPLLTWYMELDTECPFLEDSCCSIYDRRPMTCRECLVISPESECRRISGQIVQKVELPVRFSSVLTQLSRELYETDDELVVLPCVFDWWIENHSRYQTIWPAEFLVRRFVEITKLHYKEVIFDRIDRSRSRC